MCNFDVAWAKWADGGNSSEWEGARLVRVVDRQSHTRTNLVTRPTAVKVLDFRMWMMSDLFME